MFACDVIYPMFACDVSYPIFAYDTRFDGNLGGRRVGITPFTLILFCIAFLIKIGLLSKSAAVGRLLASLSRHS